MSAAKEVEVILTRRWASYLAGPVWLMGEDGSLLYYNEPAGAILGRRFDEAGAMPLAELSNIFQIQADDGSALPPEAIPVGIALRQRRPAHLPLRWRGLDEVWHAGEVTAFPLEGQSGRRVGAVAIFWEVERE